MRKYRQVSLTLDGKVGHNAHTSQTGGYRRMRWSIEPEHFQMTFSSMLYALFLDRHVLKGQYYFPTKSILHRTKPGSFLGTAHVDTFILICTCKVSQN